MENSPPIGIARTKYVMIEEAVLTSLNNY